MFALVNVWHGLCCMLHESVMRFRGRKRFVSEGDGGKLKP